MNNNDAGNNSYTVAHMVADFMKGNQLDVAFGIASVHNVPIMDAINQRGDVRMVMSRGEAGAAHMADGYARSARKTGVVITSTGPAAANAMPGLLEAKTAGTPLLHITGQTATPYIDRNQGPVHDMSNQMEMLRSVSKSVYRIRSAQEALGTLQQALLEARMPPMGPVSVEIPIDIQRAPVNRPNQSHEFIAPAPLPRQAEPEAVAALVKYLRQAKRPLLWVGSGARAAGREIRQLLDMGFCMVSSWAGRGIVDDSHQGNLGALSGMDMPLVQDLYADSDLMLVLGSRLRGQETMELKAVLPSRLIQIDIEPTANGRTYRNELFVCGDIKLTLQETIRRLADDPPQVDGDFADRVANVKSATISAFLETFGPYRDLPIALREVMPAEAVWVRDITISGRTWGHLHFPLKAHHLNIYPVSGGIGQGFLLSIGAALGAQGGRAVLLAGDGGFSLGMAELWTVAQERPDLTIIIMNDGGYGIIKHMQEALHGSRYAYADMFIPDLSGLAGLAKIPFWRVSAVAEFADIARQAFAVTGPSFIEVDMGSIGPIPPYFPYAGIIEKKRNSDRH